MTDASADELKISGIIHVGKPGSGLFKATVALVGWKNTVSGLPDNTLSLSGGDIVSAEWQRACGKGRCLLKLCFAGGDGSVSRFAGFKEQELSAVKAHLQRHFKVALSEPNVATEGWCWGDILPYQEEATTSNNPDLRVMINGKLGFDVPVCELHQVSTPSKTDLNLEFKQDPAALSSGNEILTEMRLFIPGVDSASCAENLREELLKRSGLTKVEEALLSLPQVSIVAPRGKYDVQFLPKALRIHGKTMTHTVRYDAIVRLFLLDISATLPSGMTTAIAVGLSPPMRQGKTDHYWLVLGFDESTMSVDSLSDGIIKRINIAREDHKVSSLMGKALAVFSGKTVVGTSSDFKNLHPQKHACLTVTYKAQPGLLFFCKMSFILALKPVIYHKWQDVDKVSSWSSFRSTRMRSRLLRPPSRSWASRWRALRRSRTQTPASRPARPAPRGARMTHPRRRRPRGRRGRGPRKWRGSQVVVPPGELRWRSQKTMSTMRRRTRTSPRKTAATTTTTAAHPRKVRRRTTTCRQRSVPSENEAACTSGT
mmetsp:Transcript_73580/g.238127  ORF Transcript_73580/g.238127 Transcript_73580/m.238127 type:complete len:541 (-) Transcript_73580:417-2039(-)